MIIGSCNDFKRIAWDKPERPGLFEITQMKLYSDFAHISNEMASFMGKFYPTADVSTAETEWEPGINANPNTAPHCMYSNPLTLTGTLVNMQTRTPSPYLRTILGVQL